MDERVKLAANDGFFMRILIWCQFHDRNLDEASNCGEHRKTLGITKHISQRGIWRWRWCDHPNPFCKVSSGIITTLKRLQWLTSPTYEARWSKRSIRYTFLMALPWRWENNPALKFWSSATGALLVSRDFLGTWLTFTVHSLSKWRDLFWK